MESQSPERAVTSPAHATTAKTPPPTLIPESVTVLENEEISAPTRDSTWPRPLKELEKEKTKSSAKTLPKLDPRPTPKAQALLNQEQQKKKKQQQQSFEKQQQETQQASLPEKKKKTAQDQPQNQPKQPDPAKTPVASPLPKPTQVSFGTTPTTSDKQMVASKPVSAAPSVTRVHDQLSEAITRARLSGQVLPNLRTPGGDKLGSAEEFVKAWNAADLAEGSSTTASPHPAGPSRMFQSLHTVQASIVDANRILEVTLPNLFLRYHDQSALFPVPEIRVERLILLSKKVIRLESLKKN